MVRPSWEQYFMDIAHKVAERATCQRAKVGVVFVKDKNIIVTGYNGSPSHQPHCLDVGCDVRESEQNGEKESNCVRTIHAELNAIIQAAKHGHSLNGSDVYCTHSPCQFCFRALMGLGIERVYYAKPYKLELISDLARSARITLRSFSIE